ncbi:MAG TPA: hypothetical protein VGI93_16490 [Steroidobacteraceae bacterium]|jgi:hypothetical protein
MEEIEFTWFRALKVWWSFAWRAWVLMVIILFPVQMIVLFVIMPGNMPATVTLPAEHSAPMVPENMRHTFLIMSVIWPILMATAVGVQAQAMRWMVKKTRWSDFRLAVISNRNDLRA